MKKTIVFLTCDHKPAISKSDELLAKHLESSGHSWTALPWAQLANHKEIAPTTDILLFRSVWDYHRRIDEFKAWLAHLKKNAFIIHNAVETVSWNLNKTYLAELSKQDIPIIPTLFFSKPPTLSERKSVLANPSFSRSDTIILKPSISAGSDLTHRISYSQFIEDTETQNRIVEILNRSELLVQPCLESITTHGEISLIYFNLATQPIFSHAVLKEARSGDYRVQAEFGGQTKRIVPSSLLKSFSESVLNKVKTPWIYARVDLVDWQNDPKLGELEMIEPELFATLVPESAELFSRALTSTF